ncbi:MAG: hypothetical protein IKG17_05380 [Mogibacterium sp.]|nr:hypothetical protein [Mogibacterium sp.]
MAENKELKASTESKRQKKADRRDAKAARKEANKAEDKKSRPNNILLAVMIFGVLIIMFAFAGGYNYFSKPATIEKYMADNGIDEMYKELPVSEHTTMKMRTEKNTIKIWILADEDATEEELAQYQGEEGIETLKNMGSYFLTSTKPETRALSGTVKVKAKKGDESINYVEMSYSEAKKFVKDAQKKAEEEAEKAETESDTDADADADAAETETETEGE